MLNRLFVPITAKHLNTQTYVEILPCDILKPFIRCYWQSESMNCTNINTDTHIVIPDGCMDIIFEYNHFTNDISVKFCGMNDKFFYTKDTNEKHKLVFGIRFYFWAVSLFADDTMKKSKNCFVDIDNYFVDFKKILLDNLIASTSFEDRINLVQIYLINKLKEKNRNETFFNSVYYILKAKGMINISEVCNYVCISQRQLERLCLVNTGMSPKKIADIVRFQNIWQDIYYNKNIVSMADLSYKYGYSSQSHFLNDFKKYFDMTPLQVKSNLY
ncbi:helix-turn-helix transcriptional regulator [Abyssisolibacter fermentans]|uniref:helix-turn-helix transcriptional regulator n=1 Tax=Abyssisolibacter fermentans TaxID=1766203 RepID=UPI00082BD191|nr:helix-turn-helix transcriptional regulator [Abyssisolibacter fermentans]